MGHHVHSLGIHNTPSFAVCFVLQNLLLVGEQTAVDAAPMILCTELTRFISLSLLAVRVKRAEEANTLGSYSTNKVIPLD